MRLFPEIFGRPHQRQGETHFPVSHVGQGCWWAAEHVLPLAAGRGFNVEIVGESQFQDVLAALAGGRCELGHNCEMPAEICPAGTDRDPMAVGVTIDSRPVGWLPSGLGDAVRAQLPRLNPNGFPVTCKGKIVGGWDRGRGDRGMFGVRLSLSFPLKTHPAARHPRRARSTLIRA